MSQALKTQYVRYKESPDAWQTRIQVVMRLPFPLPWVLIAGLLFIIGYAIAEFCGESTDAVRLIAIESVLIAAVANPVVFFEKLLDDVADTFPKLLDEEEGKAKQWVSRWYDWIFWSRKSMVAGLILAGICMFCAARGSVAIFASTVGKAYCFVMSFVTGFLGGSMFWTMLGIARLMSSLGRDVQIKPSIFDSTTSVLRTASAVLWKVALIAASVYILGVSVYCFCSVRMSTVAMMIIMAFAVFIILYFIVPQMNIHKTLITIKRTRLQALVEQIDHSFDNVAAQPTPENINRLRDLFHLQDIVNRKRSWSFGTGELLALIGTVLVPLLLFVLEHFIRRYRF